MKKYQSLYVAASRQHVGKTTSTLGLAYCLMRQGIDVGYSKPVGQSFVDLSELRVDKDTILFADLIRFDINPKIHSPVILGKGATTRYLDDPDAFQFKDRILEARETLENNYELPIYEGTGHPGVGSVVELSNATVAKMVKAKVIFIAEGGIGSTIDMLNMCLGLFREQNVEIMGVIVNKVRPDKIEKVQEYLPRYLKPKGIPLLGVLPYDKSLAYPVIKTVSKSVNGIVLENEDCLDNKVADILAGSVLDRSKIEERSDLLLVVSSPKLGEAIQKVKQISEELKLPKSPLSGVIVTGKGELDPAALSYIQEQRVPLIHTDLDTYGCVLKISRIEVKINRNTPWKVKRAIELIEENVDLQYILKSLK